jgi:hypothetical protein
MFMFKIITLSAVIAITALSSIPPENSDPALKPDFSSATSGAKALLKAICTKNADEGMDFFFPQKEFDLVKDIPVPSRYWKKLARWYREDIIKEHGRFGRCDWQFKELKFGRCKWKKTGTEGNKQPYWSCRGNFVTATCDGKTRRFEIKVLINWGKKWYVTHLGPIRK